MLINYYMCTQPELFYKQIDDILALMRKIAPLHETSIKVNEKKDDYWKMVECTFKSPGDCVGIRSCC